MAGAIAAGTLLYRHVDGQVEVLLVHPSGNYNRKKPWSIPKGLPDPDESWENAARRETWEEAGVHAGDLQPLGEIVYTTKSRKRVAAFFGPAPADCQPHCASWEVDRAEFVPVKQARQILHQDQAPLIDLLLARL